jgi:uncharacterized protein YjdB
MQLFSRNKAIVALSLGALALGACGDDVTVPVAPAAPITLSITPPSANMNIGEAVNFAVQISGGATAPTLASCTTSSATVATAAVSGSSCRVTAIAAGNATITATASTGQSAAASVSVAAPAAAISGLQVSPSAASVQVNQTVTIVPNVNKGASAVTVAYTYATSTASVATVTAAGVVTAVAPGVATITVTATGTGTGFATTSLTSAAAITVTALPSGMTSLNVTPSTLALSAGATAQVVARAQQPTGAAVASIIYGTTSPAVATVGTTGIVTAVGPGTAVITVTATSAANANFAAATLSGTVAVTVSPNAQLSIASITMLANIIPVDINAVTGQIAVNLVLATNGQQVNSVQTFVCAAGTTCPAAGQTPAAQQTFSGGAASGALTMALNTADFSLASDWSAATAAYSNGLKVIAVTATTAGGQLISATSNIGQLNFANQDGVAVRHQAPARSAADVNGRMYYGGPGAEGRGRVTVVPVMFTADRALATVAAGVNCNGNLQYTFVAGTDARPWTISYGATQTLDANGNPTALGLRCNYATPSALAADVSAYFASASDANGVAITNQAVTGTTPAPAVIAVDYVAPSITTLQVAGGGSTSPEYGWVNGAYRFDERDASGNPVRYVATENSNGVGLRSTRDTRFSVCNTPEVVTNLTAAVSCATPVASGGLTSTVSSMGLGENSNNLTNQAYFVVASESDRLGNTVTSVPFTYTDNSGTSPVTVNATSSLVTFGVDVTAPVLIAIPNPAATEPTTEPSLAYFARTSVDSIFSTVSSTHFSNTSAISTDVGIGASSALFAVRVRDGRSGFPVCGAVGGSTCASGTSIGTFQIERRRSNVPAGTSAPSNTAIVENIVDVPTTLAPAVTANIMDASTISGAADPTIRQFSINIFGAASRAPSSLTVTPASSVSGYYAFTGTIRDRAGNTAAIPTRRVVIDNVAPTVTSVSLPSNLTGGTQPTFTINGSADLEITGAELAINYSGFSIRYPRVSSFAATSRTGLFGSPFAAQTSGQLAAVIGTGASSSAFSGNVTLPAPLIQDLQVLATSSSAPVAVTALTAANKPVSITGTAFDIKSMVNTTGLSTSLAAWSGSSASSTATIPGYAVSGSTVVKPWGDNYTDAVTNAVTAGAKVSQWFLYTSTTTSAEFRSTSSSAVSSVPFSAVRVVTRRYNTTSGLYEDSYIDRGVATYAGTVDDGGTRYYRWTWTAGAAVSQGNQTTIAAFADGDSVRAIGLDTQGNGLMTAAGTSGSTSFGRIISAIAQGNVNVFGATASTDGSPLTQATAYTTASLFARSFASTPVTSATNIGADSRVFIGVDGSNATARVYFTLALGAGAPATSASNTTATCTSSSPDVVVVAKGIAGPLTSSSSAQTQSVFCDIRGNTAGGVATLFVTADRVGTGTPYAASTPANTFVTSGQIYVGNPTLTSLGSIGALSGLSSVGTGRVATFTIGAPTFAGAFTIANATPVYTINNAGAGQSSGVSTSVAVNALDGSATVTVTCSESAVTNVRTFAFHVVGRAVSTTGYANPLITGTGTTTPVVSGTCTAP